MATVRVAVRVRPGSSRTRVGGSYGVGELVVTVTAPPVDGAANHAVVRAVATALGVRPSRVKIVGGATARSKVVSVEIPDADEPAVRARLEELMAPVGHADGT